MIAMQVAIPVTPAVHAVLSLILSPPIKRVMREGRATTVPWRVHPEITCGQPEGVPISGIEPGFR